MIHEREARSLPGWPMLVGLLLVLVIIVVQFIRAIAAEEIGAVLLSVFLGVVDLIGFGGFIIVNPNEAQVLQVFGNYSGTAKRPGFWWINPFSAPRRKVSQRVRNFESSHLKVNDLDGNPIEIAAVVVWNVADTAAAVFQVDDYDNFVRVQTEAALRNLASSYPYDAHLDATIALRTSHEEINERLRAEIQERLSQAGIQVQDTRISHLAYAPEIAGAMLRRQQAGAVVAARARIVEGAVSMVEMALDELSKRNVIDLDEERRAAMVSNLLVVLCSEQHTQPVVNTGTLYA
jgi:regulator of protease activity HflC (stomatin/prohibitin superfamily)